MQPAFQVPDVGGIQGTPQKSSQRRGVLQPWSFGTPGRGPRGQLLQNWILEDVAMHLSYIGRSVLGLSRVCSLLFANLLAVIA